MIPVTKSFLPPLDEYMAHVKRAYDNEWLTNRGELVRELEKELSIYLELKKSNILCLNNGTIPLQIALKLLGKGGEIITTPFSYVATTAAIVWENCVPIFVDIHPEYLTIDETKIEDAITDKTTCILATHVFGNPCNIEVIEKIAIKYNLKVIYDAAHCFGVKYKGKSIFEYGDVSTCSFHATKLFHTGEGGAIFCKDLDLYNQIYYSHNFGHKGPLDFYGLGINGKISELNSAMGLSVLPYIQILMDDRRVKFELYYSLLNNSSIKFFKLREGTEWNYSYCPILLQSEEQLLELQTILNQNKIYPRRYFFPALNLLPYLNYSKMKFAEDITKRILCLPIYYQLRQDELINISEFIIR